MVSLNCASPQRRKAAIHFWGSYGTAAKLAEKIAEGCKSVPQALKRNAFGTAQRHERKGCGKSVSERGIPPRGWKPLLISRRLRHEWNSCPSQTDANRSFSANCELVSIPKSLRIIILCANFTAMPLKSNSN